VPCPRPTPDTGRVLSRVHELGAEAASEAIRVICVADAAPWFVACLAPVSCALLVLVP